MGSGPKKKEYYHDGLKLGGVGLKGRSGGALARTGQAGPRARTLAAEKLEWGRRRKGGGMVWFVELLLTTKKRKGGGIMVRWTPPQNLPHPYRVAMIGIN